MLEDFVNDALSLGWLRRRLLKPLEKEYRDIESGWLEVIYGFEQESEFSLRPQKPQRHDVFLLVRDWQGEDVLEAGEAWQAYSHVHELFGDDPGCQRPSLFGLHLARADLNMARYLLAQVRQKAKQYPRHMA
jgi:hypothetical protein